MNRMFGDRVAVYINDLFKLKIKFILIQKFFKTLENLVYWLILHFALG